MPRGTELGGAGREGYARSLEAAGRAGGDPGSHAGDAGRGLGTADSRRGLRALAAPRTLLILGSGPRTAEGQGPAPEPLPPGSLDFECGYCGHPGPLNSEIELRETRNGSILACVDTAACDARDAANAGAEE